MKTSVGPARRPVETDPSAAARPAAAAAARMSSAGISSTRAERRPVSLSAARAPDPDAVLDRAHLAHMTFGEHELECEVLRLFDQQAQVLIARLPGAEPAAAAALAHTLCGSARGIGAFKVAGAASKVEQLANSGAPLPDLDAAIETLAAAAVEARAAIADMLAECV